MSFSYIFAQLSKGAVLYVYPNIQSTDRITEEIFHGMVHHSMSTYYKQHSVWIEDSAGTLVGCLAFSAALRDPWKW